MKYEKRQRFRRRGIYLLPNLLTTLALFFGFYAIVAAFKGHFGQACLTVYIAMIFDSLDGRVARMTNTASPFGAEYDSLSDMVTFGIAPALIAYFWGLSQLGKIGWLVAFVYAVATALRLARFNIQVGRVSKSYFQGLPCPIAAAVVAGMIWTADSVGILGTQVTIFTAFVTVFMALMMVSSVPYYSFKEINFKGPVSFVILLIAVLICVAIAINPPIVLFLSSFIFTLSGPILFLFGWNKRRRLAGRQVHTKK